MTMTTVPETIDVYRAVPGYRLVLVALFGFLWGEWE